jgi:hypothetical protein
LKETCDEFTIGIRDQVAKLIDAEFCGSVEVRSGDHFLGVATLDELQILPDQRTSGSRSRRNFENEAGCSCSRDDVCGIGDRSGSSNGAGGWYCDVYCRC